MAILKSNLVLKGMRHRGIYSGKPYEVEGRIFLPAGTVLTAGDDLLFVPVGENQTIVRVTLKVNGDTLAAAGSIGHFQQLDREGEPAVVQRRGPWYGAGDRFESPATNATAYRAAGQLDGYTETIIPAGVKLPGPVDVGIRITTGATLAVDTEIFLGAQFSGETSTLDVVGTAGEGDNLYLLDPDQGVDPTP